LQIEKEQWVIADFGAAKLLNEKQNTANTKIGTLTYSAPEVFD